MHRAMTSLIGTVVLMSLASCRGQSSVVTADPVVVPSTPRQAQADVRIRGAVLRRSPNGQPPHRPFREGVVVAVPIDRLEALVGGSTDPMKRMLRRRGAFALPRSLCEAPGAGAAELDAEGRYALTLPPGEYAFCLGNLDGLRAPDPVANPVWVEQWFRLEVSGGPERTIVAIFHRASRAVMLSEDESYLQREPVLRPAAGGGRGTLVNGTVSGVSDLWGVGRHLCRQGMVIAVPPGALAEPGQGQFTMSAELYERIGVARGAISQRGEYSMSLEPGEYVFCVGNLWSGEEGGRGFPALITGRARVTVGNESSQTVDITHSTGSGGTSARHR